MMLQQVKVEYFIKMSRIIVKNIPKIFSEKEIVEHFSKVDTITDCKVVKNSEGQSRRLAFVGFKNKQTAQIVKRQFNNTYIGASKVIVDVAWIKNTEQSEPVQKLQNKEKSAVKNKKQERKTKVFQNFKKVITEQSKKSWDDMLVPIQRDFAQFQQFQKKPTKKQKKDEYVEEPQTNEEKNIKASKVSEQTYIKPPKAPRLSEKNKQYVTKPLEVASNRLFIRNIPFKLQESQIRKQFSRFGNITKIKLPKQYDGSTRGFFFLTYEKAQEAVRAFKQCDNKVIFGRILHIVPSLEDIGQMIQNAKEGSYQKYLKEKYGETVEQKSSFKKKKKKEMREKLNDTTNWNTLFLNPNTVLERMAKKLHITKSEILLSDNLAPKVALAEAQVIQQTKQWMTKNEINLTFLQTDRSLCERSKKVILIKNLNFRTQQSQLKELLEFYGTLEKILLAPNRAIAIAEFQTNQFAENVIKNLQNSKFKNNFLYLEYAPIGMVSQHTLQQKIKQAQRQEKQVEQLTKAVYIKNLNFETDENSLHELVSKIGKVKYVKIVKGKDGKSMGYGFVEYQTAEKAIQAVKRLNNALIDGHKIILSLSKKKAQNVEDIKKMQEKIKKQEKKSNKLSVKNIAFQATKAQIRDLFKEFGSIKTVRLPKKMDGQHRGFAFVEYDTAEQAAIAKQALGSAHLYGRKFVIEYEKGDSSS